MIIDLPRAYYRVLEPVELNTLQVLTLVGIVLTSVAWAIFG